MHAALDYGDWSVLAGGVGVRDGRGEWERTFDAEFAGEGGVERHDERDCGAVLGAPKGELKS